MLFVFQHIFMADIKNNFGYNFRAPLYFIGVWRNPEYVSDNPWKHAQ